MAIFNLNRWPSLLLLILAGLTASAFAFVTANLFSRAMANASFVGEHGWEAIQNGALHQASGLIVWGTLALIGWLIFKTCESILVGRYLAWAKRDNDGSDA